MRHFFLLLFLLPLSLMCQTWHHQQVLLDSFRNNQIRFGYSVDINDSFAVVGSPNDSYDQNNSNPVAQAGVATVYKRDNSGNWNFHQKLTAPTRVNGANFGWSVTIDNERIGVGAIFESTNATEQGAAYTFVLENGMWQFEQRVTPSDPDAQAKFGNAIDIYDSLMVVGAYGHRYDSIGANYMYQAGAAYFFQLVDTVWVEMDKVSAALRLNSHRFGWDVALHGNQAVIGAPHDGYDEFGLNPGINTGAVFHFTRNPIDSHWYEHQKMIGTPRGGMFGHSVSINDSFALIGSPEMSTDTFSGNGFATLFKLNASDSFVNHQLIQAPVQLDNDNFGFDVDLYEELAVVGVPYEDHDIFEQNAWASAGSMYAFQFNPGQDTLTYVNKMAAPNLYRYQGDWVGFSAAISNTAVIGGSPNEDYDLNNANYVMNAGAAHIFDTTCATQIDTLHVDVCFGDTFIFNNLVYIQSGTYPHVFTNQIGCDSTVIVDLSVLPHYQDSVSATACDSYTWPLNGKTYTQTNIYRDTLTSSTGCDSIVDLYLVIFNSSETIIDTAVCHHFYWHQTDSTYYESGEYSAIYTNQFGCDSVITLNLHISNLNVNLYLVSNLFVADIDSGVTYQWLNCVGDTFELIDSATNQGLLLPWDTNLATVSVAVVVTDSFGCIDTSGCFQFQHPGFDEKDLINFSIFPNPTSTTLNLEFSTFQSTERYQITDLMGRVLLKGTIRSANESIDISALKPSAYFITISSESGSFSKRFVVME